MPMWMKLSLQDSASPLMEQLIFFHDHIMLILTLILTSVSYVMATMLKNTFTDRYLSENQMIEMIWTSIPALILILIAFPSIKLLYLLDETNSPSITVKSVGHQWYWSYEYSDFLNLEFDSYMIPTNELGPSGFRLLDVDNRTVLPMNTNIRMIVTGADVIHSWTVPSLGVKVDAIPGRLNQLSFLIARPGLFFGQCSEICGTNHSFMPISIESTTTSAFLDWMLHSTEDS